MPWPGTWPSWSASPLVPAKTRKAPTGQLRRRRDGASDQGGAAGAGTSGRPWCLSRVHERGDHRMRKVVTGEQQAQLVNPDPFALPVMRAPVYRTPAIVTLAVQLYRLIAWLVRIIARH